MLTPNIGSTGHNSPRIPKTGNRKQEAFFNTTDTFNYSSSSPGSNFDIKEAAKALFSKDSPEGKPDEVIEMWTFQAGNGIIASPLVVKDKVVVGTQNKEIICLDDKTGEKKWTYPVEETPTQSPVKGPDNTVIVSTCHGHISCLDAETGKEKWKFKTPEDVGIDLVMGSDGTLYGGSIDNKLYALDPKTGEKKWDYDSGNCSLTSPVLSNDGSIVLGNADGKVISVNSKTGKANWAIDPENGAIQSNPAIGKDGTVFVGGNRGKLTALDGKTGKEKWAFDMRDSAGSPLLSPDEAHVFVAGGMFSKTLYAVDTKTGKSIWKFDGKDLTTEMPIMLSDGSLCVKAKERLYGVDAVTGKQLWEKSVGFNPVVPTPGKGGKFYTGARNGIVRGLKLRNFEDKDESSGKRTEEKKDEKKIFILDDGNYVIIGGVKIARNKV